MELRGSKLGGFDVKRLLDELAIRGVETLNGVGVEAAVGEAQAPSGVIGETVGEGGGNS